MGREVNSCQRVKSGTSNILMQCDTFKTPTAEDGICKHCDTYNSELDKEGYCRRDDYSGDLDCWRQRVVKAVTSGRGRMLPTGQFVWLKESFSPKK